MARLRDIPYSLWRNVLEKPISKMVTARDNKPYLLRVTADLAQDERFDSAEKLMDKAAEPAGIIAGEIASRTFGHWMERFRTLEGQWAPVLNSVEVGQDAQLRANGFIAEVTDVDGRVRELVTAPVQFDETPARPIRGPQFAEHTEAILTELGLDEQAILDLRIAGAVA